MFFWVPLNDFLYENEVETYAVFLNVTLLNFGYSQQMSLFSKAEETSLAIKFKKGPRTRKGVSLLYPLHFHNSDSSNLAPKFELACC